MSHLMKIRPVGDEMFYTDIQTDRHDEANSRFSEFYERASKCIKTKGFNDRTFARILQDVYIKLSQNSSNGLQHVTQVRTVPQSTY
jgi:hypothetical protein